MWVGLDGIITYYFNRQALPGSGIFDGKLKLKNKCWKQNGVFSFLFKKE